MKRSLIRPLLSSLGVVICLACLLVPGSSNAQDSKKAKKGKKEKREIAITFDELPAAQGFTDVDLKRVTDLILMALDTHKVKATGFVVGSNIEGSYDLLGQWLNKGHILGNLTFSHQDLHSLGVENFIRDINSGHEALETMLAGFGQKKRYFRYPFMHYGETVEEKREVSLYLDTRSVITAHATILVEDYLYNLSLEKIKGKNDSDDVRQIVSEYITHVSTEVNRGEVLAKDILKRNCRHILLLRANMLNALALDDLLSTLEKMGYTFITLDRALEDDVFSAPDAYFGARGIGFLDMIMKAEPDLLPAE